MYNSSYDKMVHNWGTGTSQSTAAANSNQASVNTGAMYNRYSAEANDYTTAYQTGDNQSGYYEAAVPDNSTYSAPPTVRENFDNNVESPSKKSRHSFDPDYGSRGQGMEYSGMSQSEWGNDQQQAKMKHELDLREKQLKAASELLTKQTQMLERLETTITRKLNTEPSPRQPYNNFTSPLDQFDTGMQSAGRFNSMSSMTKPFRQIPSLFPDSYVSGMPQFQPQNRGGVRNLNSGSQIRFNSQQDGSVFQGGRKRNRNKMQSPNNDRSKQQLPLTDPVRQYQPRLPDRGNPYLSGMAKFQPQNRGGARNLNSGSQIRSNNQHDGSVFQGLDKRGRKRNRKQVSNIKQGNQPIRAPTGVLTSTPGKQTTQNTQGTVKQNKPQPGPSILKNQQSKTKIGKAIQGRSHVGRMCHSCNLCVLDDHHYEGQSHRQRVKQAEEGCKSCDIPSFISFDARSRHNQTKWHKRLSNLMRKNSDKKELLKSIKIDVPEFEKNKFYGEEFVTERTGIYCEPCQVFFADHFFRDHLSRKSHYENWKNLMRLNQCLELFGYKKESGDNKGTDETINGETTESKTDVQTDVTANTETQAVIKDESTNMDTSESSQADNSKIAATDTTGATTDAKPVQVDEKNMPTE